PLLVLSSATAARSAASYTLSLHDALPISEGRAPRGPAEIAIDSTTADKSKYAVGDTATVLTPRHRVRAQVVGVFKFGKTGNLGGDRKSTRLNSSHQIISYAVFCLKKKLKQ